VSAQMRNDLKNLRTRFQHLTDAVADRLARLDRMVADVRKYNDEYLKTLALLKRTETNLQIEHHTASHASYGKTLEEQLNNLKQVRYDLDSLSSSVCKLNDMAGKLLGTPNHSVRFTAKLKADINELNEKLNQLRSVHLKKQYHLEDALSKANKVDSELDELANWIVYKDHEIVDDEGVIITEEQFDQRVLKYKQIKAEVERKEAQVRRILDAGNDMLKSNSNSNLSNANELASSLSSLNGKWTNLNKRVEAKNRLFAQLAEYINELRQLLHQESAWLEKAQQKMNAAKVGTADAEELSEELDSLERFLKAHTHQSKERISELSALLLDKQVLVQLANSDVKEFLFKWHLIHEEASRKLQALDAAIADVQGWEKRLLELQDWVGYMDKYLSARLDQDIFADDVPEDFARIQDEFAQNELLLKELEDGVDKYRMRESSSSSASSRLEQQLSAMKRAWAELHHKFRKFQKPADFDQKLGKVRKQLDEIEQVLYMIEINGECSDTIHMQLEHCMKFYKSLSELKGQIEFVLKQGRSIVDKRQVDSADELTRLLDALKVKYNELGSRVTNAKNELEKAFKLAKRFRKEYNLIVDFLGKIDGELRKIEQKPLSKNYNDELDWIKNTKNEISKVETINLETMRGLKRSLEEIVRAQQQQQGQGGIKQLSGAAGKINEIEQKVGNIQCRVDERAAFLHEQARKLDESYEAYFVKSRQVSIQIEAFHNDLIEAERLGSRDLIDVSPFFM
jgi:dystrophin